MILTSFCLNKHLGTIILAVSIVLCADFAGAAEDFKQNPALVPPAAEKAAPAPAQVHPSSTLLPGRPAPLPSPEAWRPGAPQARGVEKIAPGLYRLGEISVAKKLKGISFPATVNMDKGLLEYLLVRNGGKTHESLLRTAVEPSDLQVALLLLGLEGTDRPLSAQGDPAKPGGEKVEIIITFTNAAGKTTSFGPEIWIARKTEEKLAAADKFSWVFTGSTIRNNRFLAQAEGSIIAIYHDPVALVDNASPGGESDKIWFVNEKGIPPIGTPVTVTIRSTKN